MSEYTPTVWRTGDVITAEKLNNIEEGIANAGGGESDFSTVEVTVINNTNIAISASMPAVLEAGAIEPTDPAMISGMMPLLPSEHIITVALYKGVTMVQIGDGTLNISVTGNIEDLTYGGLKITGSGTITINAPNN